MAHGASDRTRHEVIGHDTGPIPRRTPVTRTEARDVIDTLEGDHARCLIHGGVLANEPGEIAAMEAKVKVHGINAWKLYPQYGVTQPGYFPRVRRVAWVASRPASRSRWRACQSGRPSSILP